MKTNYASLQDLDFLENNDAHISRTKYEKKIKEQSVIMIKNENENIGYLRFGFFWDEIPIMNNIRILEKYRGKGYGKVLVDFWEKEMIKKGYGHVITSTQEDENAQHFYRKLGYIDIGRFKIPHDEANELILYKKINKK